MEFQITSPAPSATIFLLAITLLLAVMAIGFGWLAVSATRPGVEVTTSEFVLKAPFYGRSIPLTALELEKARVAAIDSTTDIRPRVRTNGVGLPGLGLGWYKLANGEKALVALTDKRRVLYVPTDQGYSLLLSLERPEAFLEHVSRARRGT